MIRVFRMRVPKERLAAMPQKERTLFLLLGYSANQIATLMKLLVFATNHMPDEKVHATVSAAQSHVILKLLIGTLNEAWELIRKNFLESLPGRQYLPRLSQEGQAALTALKQQFGRSNLLNKIRSNCAFHNPEEKDVEAAFQRASADEDWDLYLSPLNTNTSYFVADMVMSYGMLAHADDAERMHAFREVMKQANEAVDAIGDFIGACMVAIIAQHLPEAEAEEVLLVANAPKITEVFLPFYIEPPSDEDWLRGIKRP